MFRNREKYFRKTMTTLAIDWPLIISRVPDATREIPARINVTRRAVENWIEGRTKPSADHAFALFTHFDVCADDLLETTGRKQGSLTFEQKRKLLSILGED